MAYFARQIGLDGRRGGWGAVLGFVCPKLHRRAAFGF
ncbi:MAG: hypothetical protein RI918_1941, partial [Pseudomonadota bacterium]